MFNDFKQWLTLKLINVLKHFYADRFSHTVSVRNLNNKKPDLSKIQMLESPDFGTFLESKIQYTQTPEARLDRIAKKPIFLNIK